MPSPVAAARFWDADTNTGMGEAVRRVCAMGFPERAARFALDAHSTFEEAVACLLGDSDELRLGGRETREQRLGGRETQS